MFEQCISTMYYIPSIHKNESPFGVICIFRYTLSVSVFKSLSNIFQLSKVYSTYALSCRLSEVFGDRHVFSLCYLIKSKYSMIHFYYGAFHYYLQH